MKKHTHNGSLRLLQFIAQYPDSTADADDAKNNNVLDSEAVPVAEPKWLHLQDGNIGALLLEKYKIKAMSIEDLALGCLLGVMIVDALGAPYEGHPYDSIEERCNPKGVINMVPGTHMGAREKGPRCGYYTDDTMTTMALALSIVQKQQLLAQHAADNYYKFWKSNPVYRGLPDSAQKVLMDVHDGMSITITGRQSFADGSFANGGAMRISPVGLVYRNASPEVLREAAVDAIISSHCHLQSIDGALAIALCVQYVFNCGDFDYAYLIELLMDNMKTDEMKKAIQSVADGFEAFLKLSLQDADQITDYDLQFLQKMGWLTFQIKAIEAVPLVLYALLRWRKTPEQCAINVVNLGGDNDTTGAMVGAVLGAMYGTSWIPRRWYENVENTWRGSDEVKEDADEIRVGTDAYGLDLAEFLAMELSKLDFKKHTKYVETKKEVSVIAKMKGLLKK